MNKRSGVQSPPTPKINWCLSLMIKSTIIISGRHRLKFYKFQKIRIIIVYFLSLLWIGVNILSKLLISDYISMLTWKLLLTMLAIDQPIWLLIFFKISHWKITYAVEVRFLLGFYKEKWYVYNIFTTNSKWQIVSGYYC